MRTRPCHVSFFPRSVAPPRFIHVRRASRRYKTISRQVGRDLSNPATTLSTGAGTVSMTLTNALGRQVVTAPPLSARVHAARPGSEKPIRRKRVRCGLTSVESATFISPRDHRHLSPRSASTVTVEGSAEGTAGASMAGGGVVVNVPIRRSDAAAAGSTDFAGPGTQFAFGAQRLSKVCSFGVSATFPITFSGLAAMNGDPAPRLQLSGSVGLSLRLFGSASIVYAGIDRDAPRRHRLIPPGSPLTRTASCPAAVRTLSAGRTQACRVRQLFGSDRRHALYATGYRDLRTEQQRVWWLTIPPAHAVRRAQRLARARRQHRAGAGRAINDGNRRLWLPGLCLHRQLTHDFAEADYKASWSTPTAGIDQLGRQPRGTPIRGRGLYCRWQIFCVRFDQRQLRRVDTDDFRMSISLARPRCERHRLLRPAAGARSAVLRRNHIAIAPLDIPLDVSINAAAREVRPQDPSVVVAGSL